MKKYLRLAEESTAAAVIAPPSIRTPAKPHILYPVPKLIFTTLIELAAAQPTPASGLPQNVRLADPDRVRLGDGVVIGDFTYVGRDVEIGHRSRIFPQVFIDDDVVMGPDCVIHPGVVLYRGTRIGRNVVIQAGTVIGGDGFGYNQLVDMKRGRIHHLRALHAGGVTIGDFVEIGNQACIDRGLVEQTTIGEGSKVDNLVHISHNVHIGRDCIVLSQTGLAGRVNIGDRVFILGQVGMVDGIKVGEDAVIIAKAGISSDVPPGPMAWAGRPLQPAEDEWRQKALIRRELPKLRSFFNILRKADSFDELKSRFREESERSKNKENKGG